MMFNILVVESLHGNACAAIRNSSSLHIHHQSNIGLEEEIEYFPTVYFMEFTIRRV